MLETVTEDQRLPVILVGNKSDLLDFSTMEVRFFSDTSHWLPFVRETVTEDQRLPVILVGNKSDLLDFSPMEVRFFSDYLPLAPVCTRDSHRGSETTRDTGGQ